MVFKYCLIYHLQVTFIHARFICVCISPIPTFYVLEIVISTLQGRLFAGYELGGFGVVQKNDPNQY